MEEVTITHSYLVKASMGSERLKIALSRQVNRQSNGR